MILLNHSKSSIICTNIVNYVYETVDGFIHLNTNKGPVLYVALKLLQIQGSLRNNTETGQAFEKIFVEKKKTGFCVESRTALDTSYQYDRRNITIYL